MILRMLRPCRAAAALLLVTLATLGPAAHAQPALDWGQVSARAKGQSVYFNAWAGDEKTNAFIAWAAAEMKARYDVNVQHVRLKDTSEAVTRVVAEKAAGRHADGTVDLIWINGPNFLALKQQGLLYGLRPNPQRNPMAAIRLRRPPWGNAPIDAATERYRFPA